SRRLVFGGMNQSATVYDLDANKPIVTFDKHTDQVNAVVFSPDGRHVASASNDANVKVWEPDTGKEAMALRGHARWVNGVTVSPGGDQLASAGADGTVKIWKLPPEPPPHIPIN